jgi:hypothetical protein
MIMLDTKGSMFKYAAIGVPLVLILAVRNLSNTTYLAWQFLLQSDMGNAIAALVAVGGYLLDAWNTRKAQLLEAQMQRVQAQSQKLLVPVTTQLHSIHMSLLQFVDHQLTDEMTTSLSEYLSEPKSKQLLNSVILTSPTALQNPLSGVLLWREVWLKEERSAENPSPILDFPFAPNATVPRELPRVFNQALQDCDRPNDTLWKSYELFVRHELVPAVDRIAEIIDENGHLMEPVPCSKLKQIFDSEHTGVGYVWSVAPRMWLYSVWLAYARSWHTLLARWDGEDYSQIRPGADFPLGLLFFNIEAQTIVAEGEKKLVGMSQMHGHNVT